MKLKLLMTITALIFTIILPNYIMAQDGTKKSASDIVKDEVVATVNGEKITMSMWEENYRQNLLFVSDKEVTKEKVLDDMINRIIGIGRAKQQGRDKDPVVVTKMEDVLYHAQISHDLESKLQKIEVTDKEVHDYYKQNQEYRVAHILLRVRATPEPEEAKEALEQAMKIYKSLQKNPENFSDLAAKYSQSSAANSGGDLGFQPAVRLPPEVFRAIKGKSINHITPPVRSQFGYHIVKVIAIKNVKEIDMPFYKKVVYDQKRDIILAAYFKELRNGAAVQINKKFLK